MEVMSIEEWVVIAWKYKNVFVFQMVGQFIARAVADNILPKGFIDGYKGRVDCEYARYWVFFILGFCPNQPRLQSTQQQDYLFFFFDSISVTLPFT